MKLPHQILRFAGSKYAETPKAIAIKHPTTMIALAKRRQRASSNHRTGNCCILAEENGKLAETAKKSATIAVALTAIAEKESKLALKANLDQLNLVVGEEFKQHQ